MLKLLSLLLLFSLNAQALPLDNSQLEGEAKDFITKEYKNHSKDFSYSDLDILVKTLSKKFNANYTVEQKENRYVIRSLRTIVVEKIKFQGMKLLTDREALNVMGLDEGIPFDQDRLIEGGSRLKQFYKDQSYLNAVIDIEMPQNAKNNYEIVFKIKENKKTVIKDIIIESQNPDFISKIRKAVKSHVNDPFQESQIAELYKDLREALSKFGYYRAQINLPRYVYSADETEVTVYLTAMNTESYILEFNGNKQRSESQIENAIELDNYLTGSTNLSQEIAQKIKNHYLVLGYAKVEIEASEREGRLPHTRVISFTINEGPIVKINKFSVHGRYSQEEQHYIDLLMENAPPNIRKKILSKNDLEIAFKNLIVQLQNEGFLTAKIVSTKTNYVKDNKALVEVSINIDEGPLTVIKSISVVGNNQINTQDILSILKLGDKGSPLRLNVLEQSIGNLKKFYLENGFIEMSLLNEKEDLVQYSENNTKADIQFKIFEGPRVYANQIVIEGNQLTHDKVIMAELEIKKGDIVTPSKVDESIARLQRTGFFSSVEVRTLEERTNISERTLLVKVQERDPGVFTVGAGATNENYFTIHGYTGVSYINIGGWGRAVSLRAEGKYNPTKIKYLESKFTFGYLEPYLFDTRMRLRLNITRSDQISDFNDQKIEKVNSGVLSLEQDLTSHIALIYNILGVSTYVDEGLPGSNIARKDLVIASTGPTVDIDYRDNPFNPTLGSLTKLSLELATESLGSSKIDDFMKVNGSYTYYTPLNSKGLVWANSLHGGYLKDIAQKGYGISYEKRGFLLGGRSTIRGYETSEFFPNSSDIGDDYQLFTSANYKLFKSEFRIPLYKELGMALFYDGGAVAIDGAKLPGWRQAVGTGVRYNTPIGPVNADVGFKLDRRDGESSWAFHLSIGSF